MIKDKAQEKDKMVKWWYKWWRGKNGIIVGSSEMELGTQLN